MDKTNFIAKYQARIKKGAALLQVNGSGWGEFVSCSIARELIRQAIDEACFLLKEEKKSTDNEEKAERAGLKERILSLGLQDQLIVNHIDWPYSTPPSVFICPLGKMNNKRFTSKDTGLVYKITRIK